MLVFFSDICFKLGCLFYCSKLGYCGKQFAILANIAIYHYLNTIPYTVYDHVAFSIHRQIFISKSSTGYRWTHFAPFFFIINVLPRQSTPTSSTWEHFVPLTFCKKHSSMCVSLPEQPSSSSFIGPWPTAIVCSTFTSLEFDKEKYIYHLYTHNFLHAYDQENTFSCFLHFNFWHTLGVVCIWPWLSSGRLDIRVIVHKHVLLYKIACRTSVGIVMLFINTGI